MASMGLQLLGFFLGLLSLLGTVIATLIPQWRRTAYVGSNIITATAYMKGLWMDCVWHSTGIYQCEMHRSMLALPPDVQAARALMVLSCVGSVLAIALSTVGMKCTYCAQGGTTKTCLARSGGVCFLFAGLSCLVTVSWTTNDTIRDFYNPFYSHGMKYEIGWSVYIGFVSGSLSVIGGVILCSTCGESHLASRATRQPQPAPTYQPHAAHQSNHMPSPTSASSSGYRLSDFV
ncbi:claudin-14-like [Alosa pseudoharengus]|uniref:claudin-14-like n=1 Tax=Alosa pseudoharengus TaxID=34774 RepID=UPI003F8997EB